MKGSIISIFLFALINVTWFAHSHLELFDIVETSESQEVSEENCLEDALIEDQNEVMLGHQGNLKNHLYLDKQFKDSVCLEVITPPPEFV